ncbi:MAG TPA: Rieske 2Fe-2S domain-containing protein [Terriglobales bacterium]|nr:Rieske 2Fe-2S domain-containing protein [Terriglobales bacterium]
MSSELKWPTNDQTRSNVPPKWRTDFPIEWEGDHYVSRREMVKFLTLGSLLLAAANWITAIAARFLRKESTAVRSIGTMDMLNQNGSLLFRYPTDQDPCIAVRTPEGKLVAYSQVCTHLSCAVVYSKDENKLLCPCHKGAFNVAEGAPTGGPPTRRLPRIRIEQRGNEIFASGVEV